VAYDLVIEGGTVVDGQPFMEGGEHTGALVGTLLRSRTAPAVG
jgi:hypothetical protein